MNDNQLIKNMEYSKALKLVDLISYQEGQIVSRTVTKSHLPILHYSL